VAHCCSDPAASVNSQRGGLGCTNENQSPAAAESVDPYDSSSALVPVRTRLGCCCSQRIRFLHKKPEEVAGSRTADPGTANCSDSPDGIVAVLGVAAGEEHIVHGKVAVDSDGSATDEDLGKADSAADIDHLYCSNVAAADAADTIADWRMRDLPLDFGHPGYS
jgi:hypothetical protein